ncbi:alpha/beta hydrolase family esterase [Amycolatopsis jiangsuensis]|uniref:Polyhydroxybutyrate depolymerase n=1 Tax=Amycolatopsis jiangsuensis TaxID=1181879 RepID=A0A840J872_9PSEU|nr:PHB depolymerase family esterase [Amycolatopsis jiangsuensis]MBB4689622.1 polyhydroxybutyrate depolymerase [Amycolatopsis jiangsuensis]
MDSGCGSGHTEADLPATIGDGRGYRHHAPPGYTSDQPLPLILAFHGANGGPADLEDYTGLDKANALVVYPEGRRYDGEHRTWPPGDRFPSAADRDRDLDYVKALVAETESTLCVDTSKIYATGKSAGGGFTYLLACKAPDLVSAIAPVAGAFYRPGSEHHGVRDCGSGPRRILEFHGDDDSVIDYAGTDRSRPIRTTAGEDNEGWIDEWVRRDQCGAEDPAGQEPADIHRHSWTACADDTEVVHYRVLGGDHNWPGSEHSSGPGTPTQSISATDVILDFFHVDHT